MLIFKRSLLGVMMLTSAASLYARDYSKWMADLSDDALVCSLSIPGSHDTMTHKASSTSKTQNLSLGEQLENGVRAIDIRIGRYRQFIWNPYELYCYHGIERLTDYSFETTFNIMKSFLDNNPTEFIVIHLLNGNGATGNDIKDLMNKFIEANQEYFAEFRPDLKVADMRGKIVFLRRWDLADWIHPSAAVIYDWNSNSDERFQFPNGKITAPGSWWECNFACQDIAHTAGNSLQNKKDAIKQLLEFTTSHRGAQSHNMQWTVNMLSAYTGSISSASGYAENAEQTSSVLLDFLNNDNYRPGPLGILLADWVGVENYDKYNTKGKTIVEAIVENNFKELDTTPGTASFARLKDFFKYGENGVMGAKSGVPYIADFNGDGHMDLLMSGEAYINDWSDASYLALANDEGSHFSWNIQNSHNGAQIPVYYGGHGSRFFDFNQNGHLDMLLTDFMGSGWTGSHPNQGNNNRLRFAVNDGNGNFTEIDTPWSEYTFNNGDNKPNGQAFLNCIAVGDVNNDGYPDILVQNERNNPWERFVKLYINDKGSGFIESDSHFVASNSGSVFMADLNGNGYLDIIVSGWANDDEEYGVNGGPSFHFYKNDGKGNFTLANSDINEDLNHLSKVWGHYGDENVMHLIDFDQDGKIDILLMGGLNNDAGADRQENDKYSLLLRNVSTDDGKFAFEPQNTGILATAANISRLSALADFNGDGFVDYIGYGWGAPNGNGGFDWAPNNHAYGSFSKGTNGEFETAYNLFDLSGEEGFFTFGDVDGDGMLDFISPDNSTNNNPFIYHNQTLGGKVEPQVADAPSTLSYEYDEENKRLTVSWEPTYTPSGSKSVYNVYIKKNNGDDSVVTRGNSEEMKTFMRVPAREEDGKQLTYLPFNTYLANEKAVFDNVEPGEVEVGVQSVAYNYNASKFATLPLDLTEEIATGVEKVENDTNDSPEEYFTLEGLRVENPSKGIYIVRKGNKVTKHIFE